VICIPAPPQRLPHQQKFFPVKAKKNFKHEEKWADPKGITLEMNLNNCPASGSVNTSDVAFLLSAETWISHCFMFSTEENIESLRVAIFKVVCAPKEPLLRKIIWKKKKKKFASASQKTSPQRAHN
jgi:hypothetical protein